MQRDRRKKQLYIEDKEAVQELIYRDDLTNLHNRRYLNKCLGENIEKADREQYPLSLFMIDIDKFKEINDTYGHLRGDKVLMEVADLLRESFREYDEIIRYAGDEFIVILPMTAEGDALKISGRLIGRISQYVFAGEGGQRDINLTLSLGLALYPRDAQVAEKLIYRADEALYLSKRTGRNRVSIFTQVPEDILNKDKVFELLSFEIIGKEKNLKRIKEVIDDSFGNNTARTVLIQAEAGLGKSKLQLEAASYALSKESLSLAARCTEVISSQPYQVLSANLEGVMKSLGDGAKRIIDSLSEIELSCLIELEPALQKFSSRRIEKVKLDEKNFRSHLFKALAELMIKLSQQKPLFITFDNFQWVDLATISLINYLLSNEVNEKICIVCAFRYSELIRRFDENIILRQLYEQLQRNQKSLCVELKPLSSEETKKMINSIFGDLEFDDKLNQLFYSRTEGNPYFIEESLRKLIENGSIYFKDEKWRKKEIKDDDISLGIKEIIQDKLKHMDEETKYFLSNAAVLGQEFSLEALEKMTGKSPGYIGEMIERSRQKMFIDSRETGGQEIFSFRNKLLWELLYDEVQENERNKLHEKFAQIAEASSSSNPQAAANLLAYHFKKAKDAKKASDYEKIAQDEALRSFNSDEANQYLQEVLSRELAGLKEEEEEELPLAVEPLKKDDYRLIIKVIVSLRAGIVNYGLYPKGSKVRVDSVRELYNYLGELFKGYEVISFSDVEGYLLVNGGELRAKDVRSAVIGSLASLLKKYRIQSFFFEKDVKEGELDVFLTALSKKTSEIDDLGGLQAILKQNNVAGIKLIMVHYEKILRKKLGRPQEKRSKINEVMLINYMLSRPEASTDSRSSMLDVLGRNPDYLAGIFSKGPEGPGAAESDFDFQNMNINEKADIVKQSLKKMKSEVLKENSEKQKRYKENLLQFVLNLQPELRSQILKQKNLKNVGITSDEMAKAFSELPDSKIETFFAQECERYKQGKVNFTDIKDYIKRFLPDKKRRVGILESMSQSFSACGISNEQFLSFLKPDLWRNLSYSDKLIKIKSLSAESFLDQELLESVKEVFYELLLDNKEEVVNEALSKIFKNFESENCQVRLYVAANLQSIVDILSSNDAIDCLRFISRCLVDVIGGEKDLSVFTSESLVLDRLIGIFINKKEFDLAVSITRFIKEITAPGEKIGEERKNVLSKVLAQIAKKENVKALAGVFKVKVRRTDAEAIASLIDEAGEGTVDYFVNLLSKPNKRIDPYDAYLNRRYIAEILAKFGSKSLEELRRELSATRDVEVIMNIIEVMGLIGDRGCLETLKLYSQYSNDEVRRKVSKAIESVKRKLKE